MDPLNDLDFGELFIRCIKSGGDTLAKYGNLSFDEDDVIDLCDPASAPYLFFQNFESAKAVCSDGRYEICQKIEAGEWELVSMREPLSLSEQLARIRLGV